MGAVVDIRLGDCVERMAEIDAESIDLVLTSPPYDNLRRYGSGSTFDFEGLAAEIKRTLKPGGVCVWVVGDETKDGSESGTSFRQALHFKSAGLRLHDTMIYRKANPLPGNQPRYISEFEFMFVLSNGRPRVVNLLDEPCRTAGSLAGKRMNRKHGRQLVRMHNAGRPIGERKPRGNIWTYPVGINPSGLGHDHPATFPPQLAVDHILTWTDPGDLVVDPFVGSGTTLEACLKTGRRGIGIDVDAGYLDIARRRLDSVQPSLPMGA